MLYQQPISQTHSGFCPHCGYCPHCGRSNHHPHPNSLLGGLGGVATSGNILPAMGGLTQTSTLQK